MSLSDIKALILDMDGVLWRETTPIGDLAANFDRIHDRGLQVALATNNSTKTVDQFLEFLRDFGVSLEPWQIITSSLATSEHLAAQHPEAGPVFVIGEDGIQRALEEQGFLPITDPNDDTRPVAVVVGIDWKFTYAKLRRATLHVRAGIPFYGTNPDRTYPTPEGLAPGAGSLQAALTAATSVEPHIAGKPRPLMMQLAVKRLGVKPQEALVVGDRLETDIAAGQAAGCRTALVLSGVTTREGAEAWQPPPDIIAKDLAAIVNK